MVSRLGAPIDCLPINEDFCAFLIETGSGLNSFNNDFGAVFYGCLINDGLSGFSLRSGEISIVSKDDRDGLFDNDGKANAARNGVEQAT